MHLLGLNLIKTLQITRSFKYLVIKITSAKYLVKKL